MIVRCSLVVFAVAACGGDPATDCPKTPPTPSTSAAQSPSAAAPAPSPAAPAREVLPKDVEEHAFVAPSAGFYAAFLPPGYADAANAGTRYPLVVILHGHGSTELQHGALADDFGRAGVIYVAPRAPYTEPETLLETRKPAWTAWPSYPSPWGEYGEPGFPNAEVEALGLERLYTGWIAASVAEARKRYRVTPDRIVVVGHSQGAAFAHRLAIEYPDLVKAYVAIAGRHKVSTDGGKAGTTLRERGISVLLLHAEGDATVPIAHSRELLEYLDAARVKTEHFFAPGGNHRVLPEFRARARSFIRRECCGEQ